MTRFPRESWATVCVGSCRAEEHPASSAGTSAKASSKMVLIFLCSFRVGDSAEPMTGLMRESKPAKPDALAGPEAGNCHLLKPSKLATFPAMSTLMEIQEAVAKLHDDEKAALSLWLNSQAAPAINAQEEQQLLRSLDEAMREVDAGRGVSLTDAHQLVASWATK